MVHIHIIVLSIKMKYCINDKTLTKNVLTVIALFMYSASLCNNMCLRKKQNIVLQANDDSISNE